MPKVIIGGNSLEYSYYELTGQEIIFYDTDATTVLYRYPCNGLDDLRGIKFGQVYADADSYGLIKATPLTGGDTTYTVPVKINSTTGVLYVPIDTAEQLYSSTLDSENVYAVGYTLSVDDTFTDTAGTYELTCFWQVSSNGTSGWADITGATDETFTLTEDEYGKYVRRVAYASGEATGSATTAASTVVKGTVASAAITGTLRVGQTLTCTPTTSPASSGSPSYTYQWKSASTVGGTYASITGATSATYELPEAMQGKFLKCAVSASGDAIATAVLSSATGAIAGNVASVAITGLAGVGETLTATPTTAPASITPTPGFTYQWANCATAGGTYANITGATASTYVLAEADYDKYIKVTVTGSGTATGSATSAATAQVEGDLVTATITGVPVVGTALTATPTTSPESSGSPTYSYQWYSCATTGGTFAAISGATGGTFAPTVTEFGDYLKVTITATGAAYGTATSDASATAVVADLVSVAISGTKTVGQTLTAAPTTSPTGGLAATTYSYQWLTCATTGGTFTNIANGDDSTYVLIAADANQYLKVQCTATGGAAGTVLSAVTTQISA